MKIDNEKFSYMAVDEIGKLPETEEDIKNMNTIKKEELINPPAPEVESNDNVVNEPIKVDDKFISLGNMHNTS